jgi:hypothetical protein
MPNVYTAKIVLKILQKAILSSTNFEFEELLKKR